MGAGRLQTLFEIWSTVDEPTDMIVEHSLPATRT